MQIKTDKDLLGAVAAWSEGVSAEVHGRFSHGKPAPEAVLKLRTEFAELRAAVKTAEKAGATFALEKIIRKAKLSSPEIQVLYLCLYYELVERNTPHVSTLIKAVSALSSSSTVDTAALFQRSSRLFQGKVIYSNANGLYSGVNLYPSLTPIALGIPVKRRRPARPVSHKINAVQIYKKLSDSVIAQEAAKKRVSCAVFRHLKACQLNLKRKPHERIQKANILIIGPTGTGKTHIARNLSNILGVPFVSCDATQYTEAGYVGMNVEDMLVQLFKAAGSSRERMQNGIIYIDEIDKIAAHDSRVGHNAVKDVSGLSVQQELLKLLDGTKINYTKRNGICDTEYEFDVNGVLFVAGGAFQGLEEIVKERLKRKASIGFNSSPDTAALEAAIAGDNWFRHIITEDLINYGFIPEFIGRFSNIVTLNPLSQDDVLNILTQPKNSLLSQYSAILEAAGVRHKFSAAELKAVAQEAFDLKTGARGLKAIMEARVAPLLFDEGTPQEGGPKAA